jgi:hypothetical protein
MLSERPFWRSILDRLGYLPRILNQGDMLSAEMSTKKGCMWRFFFSS